MPIPQVNGHVAGGLVRGCIRVRANEEGFTVVELMAALSVLAVGFFALAAALGIGFRQVAHGRQRQTATEIGNGRVEHLRNVPYEAVALSSRPVHNADAGNPDHFVSLDGTRFDYSGGGTYEDLVVDEAGGQVLHLEDPVTVGTTIMEVYQYVTWVDQANDVKRVTVAVVYKTPAIQGVSKMVRVSSFFTPGTITVGGTSSGASQGSSSSPSPSPSPSPSGSCSGDTAAPTGSFAIASGTGSDTGYTASATVTLSMDFTDGCSPITVTFSNDDSTYGEDVTYDAANATVSWTLATGDGTKSVYAKARDGVANEASFGPETIVLDTTKPTVPGTLSRTLSCSGNDRTASLSWGTSTDTNFSGYRVYRSIDSGAWTVLTTTSGSTASDTHLKTLDSVRYKVVGYDKAGNESDETNTISLSKNQCG